MLQNQIKVLLQRVRNGGREPRAICLSKALRDALRLEMAAALRHYQVGDKQDIFYGIPVKLVRGTTEPLIELEPLDDNRAPAVETPEPGSLGMFAPKWKKP